MAFAENGAIFLPDREIPAGEVRTQLRGKHNVYNITAALMAATAAGADTDRCLASLPDFMGLEHRLEYVGTVNGVEYINDSICTIPEAAIAAVKAFPDGRRLRYHRRHGAQYTLRQAGGFPQHRVR